MKNFEKYYFTGLLFLLIGAVQAQQDCKNDINYSISNVTINGGDAPFTSNDDGSVQITIGQAYAGSSGSFNQGISARNGFWGHYLLEPQAPRAKASEGEYLDRIEVEWEVVDDYRGPVVTGETTKIYRNGRLLTTVPISQTTYVDNNVFPGEFYEYGIVTTNSLGDARPIEVVGFLQPNGRVTGKVETRQGTPVSDVKVTLTPNLGRSLELDGTDDYAYFLDQDYELGDYYTVEGWWRNVVSQNQTLIVAVDSGTTVPMLKISLDQDGKLHYYHDGNADGTGVELVSRDAYNLTANDREWHHFAAVYDTTNMYLYVDGQRVAEIASSDPMTEKVELEIGKDGPKVYTGYFEGYIDEFRVWNVGREREEIRRFKDITLTGEEEYLQSYWKFDEQFSDKIFDFAENEVELREHGYICGVTRSDFISPAQLGAYTDEGGDYLIKGVFYGAGTTFSVTPSKKTPIGYSLDFDGTDDFISYQLDRLTYHEAFTLEGWFKTPTSGQRMVIYEATNPEADQTYIQLGIESTGAFFASSGFSGTLATITSTDTYDDEFWYHYALVHEGGTVRLYIDGQEVGSTTDAVIDSVITRTVIGRSGPIETNAGSDYFSGSLDEIRLWNYARTSNQVNATLNQIIPGNERGIVDDDGELGLMAYWMLGEGQGVTILDSTPNGHAGELKNPQETTISSGDVLIANWNDDDIPLEVEFFEHDFDPNARNVSLDPSNTSVDRVDFTDISQIGISGFIKFADTDCFVPDVEIKINGASLVPPVFTSEDGKYFIELEPGTTSAFMTAEFEGYTIDPGFIELPRLVRPIAGLKFESTTKRKLKGFVVGGECSLPIGGGDVTITANNGCFEKTVAIDETNGSYLFEDIPPLAYNVSVSPDDLGVIQPYFDAQGAQSVNLIETEEDSIDFVYRSATQVRLEILNTVSNDCDFQVNGNTAVLVNQNHEYEVRIEIFQDYAAGECILNNGVAYIADGISVFSPQDTVQIENSEAIYTIKAGAPNIAAPHTKQITITAEDAEGSQAVTSQDVVVLGFKTLESTFETTTPELPFLILRDPPGDASYSYLEENTTTCNSFSFEQLEGSENSISNAISMGFDTEFSVGLGYEQTFAIDVTADLSFDNSFTNEYGMTFEQEVCLTSSNIFSTSDSDNFVGEDGDVFVGGALNVLVGTNRILELTDCGIVLRDEVAISPSSFSTTYLYTQSFIQNQVIPDLRDLGKDESADMWGNILEYNESLKSGASFKENLSFSAGSNLERAFTEEQTTAETVVLSSSFANAISSEVGIDVNGIGFSLGISSSSTGGYSRSNSSSENVSKTVGYALSDDDPDDNFTFDVKTDAVGMPVFDLIAGESVCPWEGGTQTRAEVQLTPVTSTSLVNVPENEPAVFQFTVGNISETQEDGFYSIRVIQESNPDGAVVKVNGIVVEDLIELYVRASQSETITVTVEKGPDTFVHNNIEIEAFVGCELDRSISVGQNVEDQIADAEAGLAPWFFDRQTISVEFTKTCSDVEIQSPEQNWVINGTGDEDLPIVIQGFDLDMTELSEVRFQYREKAEGNPFVNDTILTINVDASDIWSFDWNVDLLSDGVYELRAVSVCAGDFLPGVSNTIEGIIDRAAPVTLGTPTPIDDVLSADDEISILFNEDINCDEIVSLAAPVSLTQGSINNVALTNTELGTSIEATVTCEGNRIVIIPNIQNKFIEDQVIRVDLLGLQDVYGNVQTDQITWEFLVDRDPLEWLGGDIQSVSLEGESPRFTRQIKNNGAFAVNVNLSGALDVQTLDETLLPSWISATPRSFTLPAGGTQDVSFTVSDQLSGGQFNDVVTAATSFGAPELRFDVRVLCPDPNWSIDASDFENSMTFTGQLDIQGDLSTDEYDIVAAFVGNELRGVGQVQHAPELENVPGEHPYLVFMTLYTNSTEEEMIEFQVWDASRCQLYGQIAESYAISLSTTSIGSPTDPATVTVTNDLIQNIPLSSGWNWFSLNLNTTSSKTNSLLTSLSNSRGDIIKSRDQFSQYVEELGWAGSLTKLDSTRTFRIRLNKADTLVVVGEPIDFETTQIQLDSGWNWISFLPPVGMELNEALSGITATADFIIKSQTSFAQYVDFQGWIGSLDFLRPNEGYLIFTDRSATLEYPVNNANARIADAEEVVLPDGWFLDETFYEFNSNHILRIDGIEVSDGDFIGLFKEDQLVGWGEAKYLPFKDQHYFFVTSYSNETVDQLNVRIVANDVEIQTDVTVKAKADQMQGSVENPIVIDLSAEVLGLNREAVADISVYPNPFEDYSIVSLSVHKQSKVTITLSNLAGQVVSQIFDGVLVSGAHEIRIDRNVQNARMAAGVYLLHIKTDDASTTRKLIVR